MLDYLLYGYFGIVALAEVHTIASTVLRSGGDSKGGGNTDAARRRSTFRVLRGIFSLLVAVLLGWLYFRGYLSAFSTLLVFTFVYLGEFVVMMALSKDLRSTLSARFDKDLASKSYGDE